MLDVNAAMQIMVADVVTAVHAGDLAMTEDDRSQKLILMGLTAALEDGAAEDAVYRMTLALKEEFIDS